MLHLKNIITGYQKIEVIHDVTLSVNKGDVLSIIGANGAGKTTLLSTISAIQPIWSGEIIFEDEDITAIECKSRVARGIVHVPEGRLIFPRLTVKENLTVGSYLINSKTFINNQLEFAFSLFPVLKERLSQYGGTLSGGEQQMLAISRGLMSNPKLLLLDEPSLGIAPLLTLSIFEAIKRLQAEGLTIIVVEQNAKLALNNSNRSLVLETGRIVIEDTPMNLLSNTKVQEVYLGGA